MAGIKFPKIKLPRIKWPKKRRPKASQNKPPKEKKIHSWRLCPLGYHWVRTHSMRMPPSKKNPDGYVTSRREHCAKNPTGKDQLYPDEIQEISERYFQAVKDKPYPIDLGFGEKGNQYDDLIAGWTKYWNDILKPNALLSPNVVKALIASESDFDPNILANKKDSNSARGLLQITNETRKTLGNEKGELKNHFLTLTREDLNNPSNNVCAGIRWLFRKHAIASDQLKRTATWEEAVFEFKGLRKASKERASKLMNKFKEKLELLEKCLKF